MADGDTLNDPERRDFLTKATTAVGVAGAAAACWPFVSSMNPSVPASRTGREPAALRRPAPVDSAGVGS